jgi:hypothetical protein
VAAGLGPGSVGSQDALLGRVEASLGLGARTFSLRYSYVEESCHSGGGFFCAHVDLPRAANKEVALLYGVKFRAPFVVGLASIGPAALWTTQRGSLLLSHTDGFFFGSTDQYNSIKRFTVGAAIEAGVYLSSRIISIGPTVAVDLDVAQSSLALLLDLHLGYMGEPGPSRVVGNVDKR